MALTNQLNLTGPAKKSKNGKSPKLEVQGHEQRIKKMRQLNQIIESAKVEYDQEKEVVVKDVQLKFIESERNGDAIKTALVDSADGVPAKVTRTNKAKQISTSFEQPLVELLGEQVFRTLFDTHYDLKLREGASFETLKQLLGEKLLSLLEITPYLATKSDYIERRAQLRPVVSENANVMLDQVSSQCLYAPMVSVK
jgi:hypothetical protein